MGKFIHRFIWLREAVELVKQQHRRNLKDLWSSTQLSFSDGPHLPSLSCSGARSNSPIPPREDKPRAALPHQPALRVNT